MNQTIFSLKNVYRAYLDCRKNKRKTINALKFEWNLEKNIFSLQKELGTKKYRPGRSICFVVKEPSPREIFAASFRDRVVHHLLINEVEAIGEKKFIFDTFSCRKNKGTHAAIRRLKKFIGKITENNRREAAYLQLDISGFFMAISHDILYGFFKKLVSRQEKTDQWKEDVLWLAKTIIFHKPTKNYIIKGNLSLFNLIPPRKSLFESPSGQGLPIGNYSSQFFANLYLNELDQFIKRELKCGYYVRYVDDFILLDGDKDKLKRWRNKIGDFLKGYLNLELSLKKQILQPLKAGLGFLGYFIKPDHTLVRQKTAGRLKEKLSKLNRINEQLVLGNARGKQMFKKTEQEADQENEKLRKTLAVINSYYGHFKHSASFNLRKNIFEDHLGGLKEKFLPNLDYSSLKINEN